VGVSTLQGTNSKRQTLPARTTCKLHAAIQCPARHS